MGALLPGSSCEANRTSGKDPKAASVTVVITVKRPIVPGQSGAEAERSGHGKRSWDVRFRLAWEAVEAPAPG
ncbi:hypothetical protein HOK021_01090 [Streptomyces hygroscopicus]|nr:hypothetical protein HOK021_01090 [Streptomyces hygroscopicus]